VWGRGVKVLAQYPDGSAAVIARSIGKGEVILAGVHFERPSPSVGGEAAKATPGYELLAGDFDEDCDVDWDDFTVFAGNWLENNSL